MSEWRKVKLGEITESCLGKMLDATKNRGEFQPYLANINVRWGAFNLKNLSQMKFEPYESERYGIRYGDLIICEGGEPGRCAIWKEQIPNMKIQKALHRVRPIEDKVNNFYLFYWFLLAGKRNAIDQYCTGATIKHLPAQKLKEMVIDLPSLSTQNRIATILSRYDSLIDNYQKQIKLLEEAAQRLYKEWFVNLRFPGHENTKIVDGVPEGWEKKSLNQVINLQSGFAFKSSSFDDKGKYKLVTIKNVKDGSFDGDNVNRLAEVPEKMPIHCRLNDGDILLSLTGNVGRVCLVNGENYLLNQRVAKLKSKYQAFTYCLFRSHDMFVEVNNLANGAAQQNVSPIRIGQMQIVIPNEHIINAFEFKASKFVSTILKCHSQLRLLTESRDRLLPKLMSGEIEV